MPTVVCHHCSEIFTVDGPKPDQCPSCGRTLHIEGDPTPTGPALHSTVIHLGDRKPTAFGRYVVQSRLGAGGFGSVFLAKDPQLDRLVAIKVPRGETGRSPLGLERFAREGRNIAQLRHPGIVSVFNVELDGELPFIVCEYVEGETLSDHMRKAPLSFREAARLIADVATAVDYAHECGIIHRDIKPSNIMIDSDGKPRLMDFGLAKREAIDNTVTSDHAILGTPAYMSPEQAWGGKRGAVDRRSDIYSLGTVLYQLLTRELPFRGEPRMVLRQVIEDDPKSPRTLNADIPRDLETICEKAMQKEPGSRYQTARALADDLENWLAGKPIEAKPPTRLGRSWRWCRRNPAPAGLIVGAIAFLVALSGGLWGYAAVQTSARRNADNARKEIEEALSKNQELLSRAYAEHGERHLRVSEMSDDYAPLQSLPWLMEAMHRDKDNPERLVNDRIRLQTLLDSSPRVERMWFFKGEVTASGVSPKRDRFFIAARNGTVNIWNIAGDAPPVVLNHPDAVTATAFSPDGTRIATGCVDGLRIWATDSGKCLVGPLVAVKTGSRRPAPAGPTLITCGKAGRFVFAQDVDAGQVWNVDTGEPIGKPKPPVSMTADFADSDRLLVLSFGGATHVFDVRTGNETNSLKEAKDRYIATSVASDGHTIASCARSARVVFWNAVTGKTISQTPVPESTPMHESPISPRAFSPSGEMFATGDHDGTVRMWNVADGRLLWKQVVFADLVGLLQFSPDGTTLSAGRLARRKLCTLDTRSGRPIADPISIAATLNSANWLASSGQMLTIEAAGVVRLWNVASQVPAVLLPVVNQPRFAVSANRRALAIAELQQHVWIINSLPTNRLDPTNSQRIDLGDVTITAVALTDDGSRIAISGERNVFVFDTLTSKQLSGPYAHADNVTAMRFTPDGSRLVCVSSSYRQRTGQAVVWDVATGQRCYEALDVSMNPVDVDIDRDGKLCAVAANKGITVFEVATGRRAHPGFIAGVAPEFARFVADGNHILSAAFKAPTRIWDAVTGQPISTLSHRDIYQTVACWDVSADKSRFLTGSNEGTARLWDSRNADPASPPFEHPAPVFASAISPTGQYVLTVTKDFHAFLWQAGSAELLSVVPLRHAQLLAGGSEPPLGSLRLSAPLVFFSPDERVAYIAMKQGLLVTLSLAPDGRIEKRIAADIAVRSGTKFDGVGGLTALEPADLAAGWEVIKTESTRVEFTKSTSDRHLGDGIDPTHGTAVSNNAKR